MPLPRGLFKRCCKVFCKCDEFKSTSALESVFAVKELTPFRDRIPTNVNSTSDRAHKFLAHFADQSSSDGQPVLVLFLEALRDRYNPGNALRDDLDELRIVVEQDLTRDKPESTNSPTTVKSPSNVQEFRCPDPEIIKIPTGPFWMGSPLNDPEAPGNEKPRRTVELPEYWMSRYPITNAQYASFVGKTGHQPPEHWHGQYVPPGMEDHPVVNVSHKDATAYCRWLGQKNARFYRLPSEEEWEKAARGGYPSKCCYPWGNNWHHNACNTKELGIDSTTAVHEFEHINQSPFGVVDMAGNIWEWTDSWYERYPNSPHESWRYGREYRVVRGGAWKNPARHARVSCRGRYKPDTQRSYLGFRIVLDVSMSQHTP